MGQYATASRQLRYVTRQTRTLYIATARPADSTYAVDVSTKPKILSSLITATGSRGGGFTFSGANAPAQLVTALMPATTVMSFVECSPVVGTPYFECCDTATKLYVGD